MKSASSGTNCYQSCDGGSSVESTSEAPPTVNPELNKALQCHAIMEYIFNLRWVGKKRYPQIADCFSANIWSKRCDTVRDKKSVIDDTAEDRWKDSAAEWPLAFDRCMKECAEYADKDLQDDLRPEGVSWLTFGMADTMLGMLVTDLLGRHPEYVLDRLAMVHYRCTKGIEKHLITSRIAKHLGQSGVDLPKHLDSIAGTCIAYGTLGLTAPESLSPGLTRLSNKQFVQNIRQCCQTPWGAICVSQYLESFSSFGETEVIDELIRNMFDELQSLNLSVDMAPLLISSIRMLALNSSVFRAHLTKHRCWLGTITSGYSLMVSSFFGRMLTPGLADWNSFASDALMNRPAAAAAGLSNGRRAVIDDLQQYIVPQGAMPGVQTVLTRAKQTLASHLTTVVQIVKALLKDGGEVKQQTLNWFVLVIEQNQELVKMSYRQYQTYVPQLNRGTEILATVLRGVSPTNFNYNVCWVLLELCRPIKLERIGDLDGLFVPTCRKDKEGGLLGPSILTEACMAEERELEKLGGRETSSWGAKFTTQIFWLTLKAARYLLYQVLNDVLNRQMYLVKLVTEGPPPPLEGAGNQQPFADKDRLFAEMLALHAAVRHDDFTSSYLHFMDLLNGFMCRAIFKVGAKSDHPNPLCRALNIPKQWDTVHGFDIQSAEFMALPVSYVSDAYEGFFKFCVVCQSPILQTHSSATIDNAFGDSNCELFASVILFLLGGPDTYVKSPALRLEVGARCLTQLGERLHDRMVKTVVGERNLVSSVCMAFVHAQKLSYYMRLELRMYLALELHSLQRGSNASVIHEQMATFAVKEGPSYERFLHYFASNTSWVLDEAVTLLTEIKERETNMKSNLTPQRSMPRLDVNGLPIVDEETNERMNDEEFNQEADRVAQEIEGGVRNVDEMDFDQLTKQCKNLMDAGSTSLNAFSRFDSRTFDFIRSSYVLINPTVCCLDSCLTSLVGPKCMALKVSNFENYNFKPRQFLADLVQIYVKLMGTNDEHVMLLIKAIKDDGRYFDPATFAKAAKITKREGLVPRGILAQFQHLVDKINDAGTCAEDDLLEEILLSGEVPDEFIDPLMSDIMTDPVKLPTSNVVVERKFIERHLLADQFDPFNRAPLVKEQLIPQPELKQRIQEFIKSVQEKRAAS